MSPTRETGPARSAPANLVAGRWLPLDPAHAGAPAPGVVVSRNPAMPADTVFAASTELSHVDAAVAAAQEASRTWRRWSVQRRAGVLMRFRALAAEHAPGLGDALIDEVGKPAWEARAEVGLLGAKVDITLDESPTGGRHRVTGFSVPVSATRQGACLFRPHGVMAVLGPFNFPMHLPNGHIVPALLAGDTVVFKPSDKAPLCGQLLVDLFDRALRAEADGGPAPAGVINLVHGGADVAQALVAHAGVDAIAFTGSWPVGRAILQANLDRPGRIVALEMGGNNAAVVMDDADLRQAAIEIARCAFNTTGQRCTCTRRAIVHEAVAPRLLPAIVRAAAAMAVGPPRRQPPVFMGPIITDSARRDVLDFQRRALAAGAEALLPAAALDRPGGGWFIGPGVLRVDRFSERDDPADSGCDREVFGPLLRVSVVRSFHEALAQANATRFGLAASLFTHRDADIETFLHEARAGCVNINTGTAGASSKLPFGGLGLSGNHRPAGAFALDYCAYPVASMREHSAAAALADGFSFDDAWLA